MRNFLNSFMGAFFSSLILLGIFSILFSVVILFVFSVGAVLGVPVMFVYDFRSPFFVLSYSEGRLFIGNFLRLPCAALLTAFVLSFSLSIARVLLERPKKS